MHKSGLVELEAVIAVAKHRNFRAAATELGMSSTAVSSAVAGIEARLGVRLFNRTTRSVSLSSAGEEFVAQVAPAVSNIQSAMESANSHGATPSGTLRINSSLTAAHQILSPIVLDYLRLYPGIKVDLVTEARLVDIVLDGFDAGIRLAESVPRDMIAVPLGSALSFSVVGSPAYFENKPIPSTPGDLMSHRCIRARWPSGGLYRWEFERQGEKLSLDVPGPLTLDEPSLMLKAAIEGAGLAYLSDAAVETAIAEGRLARVLTDWIPTSPGLCLYYPGHRHVPAALRAFIAMVREANVA
ncbi:MAG: LysR family transcriptional regulator [Methylocella sp.]